MTDGAAEEAGTLGATEGAFDEEGIGWGALEAGAELTAGWADEAGTDTTGALDGGAEDTGTGA
jgi:hypothetical protein